jgi:hypothetical protein
MTFTVERAAHRPAPAPAPGRTLDECLTWVADLCRRGASLRPLTEVVIGIQFWSTSAPNPGPR